MAHEVFSNLEGKLQLVRLPLFQGERRVRAALVVALGLGPIPGQTRLALAGGAHVDVTKAWMQNNAPAAGKHYFAVNEEGIGEAVPSDSFEAQFSPVADDEAEVEVEGEQVSSYLGLIDDVNFIAWLKQDSNFERLEDAMFARVTPASQESVNPVAAVVEGAGIPVTGFVVSSGSGIPVVILDVADSDPGTSAPATEPEAEEAKIADETKGSDEPEETQNQAQPGE